MQTYCFSEISILQNHQQQMTGEKITGLKTSEGIQATFRGIT